MRTRLSFVLFHLAWFLFVASNKSGQDHYGWTSQKWNRHPARGQLPLLAYLFGTFPASEVGRFVDLVKVVPLARKVFGRELIDSAVNQGIA